MLLGEIKYTTETTPTNSEGYKEYTLKEVVKIARRPLTMEQLAARKASIGYNVGKVSDAHRDIGISEATDIVHMLQEENQYFSIVQKEGDSMEYRYKGRPVRFLFNNTPSEFSGVRKVEALMGDEIEKILIVEVREVGRFYYPLEEKEPVIVMLIFFKDGIQRKEPIGIRKTTFQGYSISREFYSPVYRPSLPILEGDHRRTLYWSPDLKTDASGKVEVRLYMNRKDQEIIMTAEGLIQ